MGVWGVAASQGSSDRDMTDGQASAPGAAGEVSGKQTYARHCSVCHGETGLGLEEAREAFPEDHRRCARCHRPGNPPTMSYAQIEARQHNLFDIGIAPALRGEGSMGARSGRAALRRYIAATMPRWNPGSLSDAEYDALTDFLFELNGR